LTSDLSTSELIVYGDKKSGNCYKIQLVCAFLNIEYKWLDVDIMANECQSPAFIKLNPNAKIPLLLLASDQTISESNAIINYLAAGSTLVPTDSFLLAKVQQWQFFEQYSHEPYIAVARFINKYLGLPKDREQEYKAKQLGGHEALRIMDGQLKQSDYLVGNTMTVADISLFAYTHVAPQGGVSLGDYPNIQRWIQRIEAENGFMKMG